MPRGQEVSQDVRLIIIRMSAMNVSTQLIASYTNIVLRTVQNILQVYKSTGRYQPEKKAGKKRKLDPEDTKVRSYTSFKLLSDISQYLLDLIHETPEYQLADLQAKMLEHRGIPLSTSTIWRTLNRAGYSMKTVRIEMVKLISLIKF
jgi:transposase